MASGGSTYPSTNERTNYARLCRAIVDLCTDVLREVLSTLVVPSQLKNKVRSCADLNTKPLSADERHKINVASNNSSYRNLDITFLYKLISSFSTQELRDDLSSFIQPSQIWTEVQRYPSLLSTLNKEQEAKIKYASTTGNYSMCDCWLLSHLLKHLCPGYSPKLLPSINKWGGNSLPLPTKKKYGDDVERIRFLRNKVYGHVSDTCVTDAEFQRQWSEVSEIMSRMDHRMKTGGRYTNDLRDIETGCMDDKSKEEFISEMKILAAADKDVRSEIGKQGEEILYVRTKIEAVEKSTEQLNTTVKSFTEDMKKIKIIEVSQDKKEMSVPSHIIEQNKVILEAWKREDVVFVETRGTKKVLEAIKNQKSVTVIGNAGSGKSATIHHVALVLNLKGYQILDVNSPAEIMQYLDPRSRQVFVIDDPVGTHGLDEDKFKLWLDYHSRLDKCTSVGRTKLLFSTRKQITKESSFTRHETIILNRFIVDIQDKENALNEEEKSRILKQHLKITKCNLQITDELRTIITDTHELFPLVCKLFSSRVELQKIGSKFFKDPFELVLADLDEMQSHDKLKYCVLVICFVFENDLNPNKFNPFDNIENIIKAKPFIETCGVIKSGFIAGVKETCHSLNGVYLRQEGDVYRFSHDLIHDVVSFHFGQHNPKQVIELSSSAFIRHRVAVSKDTADKDPYVIILESKYFKTLLDRLITDLDKGIYNHTLMNKCWNDKMFFEVFSKEFSERKNYFLNLFSRKIKEKPVYAEEVDNELKQYEDLQILSWYYKAMKFLNIPGITCFHWVVTFSYQTLFHLLWSSLSPKCRHQICVDVPLLHLACLGGNTDICSVLLKVEHKKINSPFIDDLDFDELPLHLGAYKSIGVVRLLLRNGARVDGMQKHGKRAGRTALSYAAVIGNNEVVSELISHGADIGKGSPLMYAALNSKGNSAEVVQLLLDNKASVDMQRNEGWTALMLASRYNSFEVVQLLLDHKASVDMQNNEGWTALMAASQYNSFEVVQLLLYRKASAEMQLHDGTTALMLASRYNSFEVVQLLLDHKASVDMQDNDGRTALMFASRYNSFEVVQLLLDHKASVDMQDNDGRTALMFASRYNSFEVVQLLLDHKASVDMQDNDGRAALMFASRYNTFEVVQLLLDHKASVDMQHNEGWTALMLASRYNSFEVVQLLLDHKASVDMQHNGGSTALMLASRYNSFEVVQLLLDHKASVDVQDIVGWTALMLASKFNSFEVVQLLLDHKASVDMQDNDGWTALMFASRYNSFEVVQLLLDHKASVDMQQNEGWTDLMLALRYNSFEAVQLLLDHKASVDIQHNEGWTALMLASRYNPFEVVQLLLDHKASVDVQDNDGWTALMLASKFNSFEVVQLLLDHKVSVDTQNNNGTTALMLASEYNSFEVVQLLLDNKASLDLQNKDNRTALIMASMCNKSEIIKLLLQYNANTELCDKYGMTAFEYAENSGCGETFTFRKKHKKKSRCNIL